MIGFKDIEVTDDGDLVAAANGDIKVANTWRTTMQDTVFRIRTQIGNYTPDTDLGSNVHSKIGDYNTRQNGETIKSMVVRALSYDNRFDRTEYSVDVVPINQTQVVIIVEFRGPFSDAETDEYSVSFLFKYDTGDLTVVGA